MDQKSQARKSGAEEPQWNQDSVYRYTADGTSHRDQDQVPEDLFYLDIFEHY